MDESRQMLRVLWFKFKEVLVRGTVCPAFFDITSKCNLRCPHCYFFRGQQTPDLDNRAWERLFVRYRGQHIHHAVLSGGEPTLNMEAIFLADRFFPIVNIATNGLIPVPPVIEHTILISLDGCQETHDSIRGQGVFDRVLANYQGDKRVILRMTVNKLNLGEIQNVTRIAHQTQVRGISFIFHAPFDRDDALCLDEGELEEARARILAMMAQYRAFVYLTPKMLDAMVGSRFGSRCKLKNGVALYSDGTPKKCSMNNIDCAQCKCPTPALLDTYRTDLKTLLLGLKFY